MKRGVFLVVLALAGSGCREPSPEQSAAGPIPDASNAAPVLPGAQTPEDRALSQTARNALGPMLENQTTNDLVVVSSGGVVHLRGRVASHDLRDDITRTLMQMSGVTGVNNELAVDTSVDISELRLRDPEAYKRLREGRQ